MVVVGFRKPPKLPHNQIFSPFIIIKRQTHFPSLNISNTCHMNIRMSACTKNYNSAYTEL
jgi:hypothetical protein